MFENWSLLFGLLLVVPFSLPTKGLKMSGLMETQKRERSANFNTAEVRLLVSLVEKCKQIIENKKTDAVTNKDKESAWRKIEDSFNSCGISSSIRTWKTLKLKYEGIKKATKKKSSLHRQQMYKTGGGPSSAPDFDDVDEKVLSICSNITGLEARHDSDTITQSIPIEAVVVDDWEISTADTPEQCETENMTQTQAYVKVPDLDQTFILDHNDEGDAQKDNKWDKWHPKALKTRVANVLKPGHPTKASVTSKLDILSTARLELVQLQTETARQQLQFMQEEHKLKMLHLANDEKRKEEIHALLIDKMRNQHVSNDMI